MCRLIFLVFLITTSNVSFSNEWNAQNFFTYFHFKSNDNYGKRLTCKAQFYTHCTYFEKDMDKLRNVFKDKKFKGLVCVPNKLIMDNSIFAASYRFVIDGDGFYYIRKHKYHVKVVPVVTSYETNVIRIDWGGGDYLELNRETLIIQSHHKKNVKFLCKMTKPQLVLEGLLEEISNQKKKNKL